MRVKGPNPFKRRCTRCRKLVVAHQALRFRAGKAVGGVKWAKAFMDQLKGFVAGYTCIEAVK